VPTESVGPLVIETTDKTLTDLTEPL
jgi:hypothetical protein